MHPGVSVNTPRMTGRKAWGIIVICNVAFFVVPQCLNLSHSTQNFFEVIWLAVSLSLVASLILEREHSRKR